MPNTTKPNATTARTEHLLDWRERMCRRATVQLAPGAMLRKIQRNLAR